MFDPADRPHIYGVPPGVDFPRTLIDGLRARLKDQPPHAMAQVDLIVNTRRMARRLRGLFEEGPPGFLPRIRLLTHLDGLVPSITAPPATHNLRRRLELIQLVSALIKSDERIAPRTSLFALSDSLASLIDEMQGEGVGVEAIVGLDVSDSSGHWERAQHFLRIAHSYLAQMQSQPDAEARQRSLVQQIAAYWQASPPQNPVILAGSTGSRGTTSLLMQAVAKLPQGSLVLPGFDFDMPAQVWPCLDGNRDAKSPPAEDHPQYRFRDLMKKLDVAPGAIRRWTEDEPASDGRNALVSLSLRPAPVTDSWLTEGPGLPGISEATKGLTLLEAPSPRIEALAIAMRLRKAVDEGKSAALITPDRMLTRQVTSALDRWGILPDDSAGTPLHLSPPGRFLRHVAGLFVRKLDAEALLSLLKHPLAHSGAARNEHQLHTLLLEAQIRKDGLPYPDVPGIRRIAEKASHDLSSKDAFLEWANWVAHAFCDKTVSGEETLESWVSGHLRAAEEIASGPSKSPDHELWKKKTGQKARDVMDALTEHAAHGGKMSAADYADVVGALLSTEEVRDRDAPHPNVMIWGTLEARVQGADLVILGGLNDGSWPEAPAPDPWLNRQMRLQAGLLLPERRIGLSAHDYQQAIAAPEVWLTRSIRSEEAETVPSRWLSRLENLLAGVPGNDGPSSLAAMRDRGKTWINQTKALEAYQMVPPAKRPSPCPPVNSRPKGLSVTEIKRLIRDPYAIYARHILRLRPMNPLVQAPDAPVRGIVLHQIMEAFIKAVAQDPAALTVEHLLDVTDRILAEEAPWPAARHMWRARMARIAEWFVAQEQFRQTYSKPMLFEKAARGQVKFDDLNFTLTGFADRIDLSASGDALVYDYKTGTPPSKKVQKHFDKQLLLEAAMIEEGGFDRLGPTPVARAAFIGLGSRPVEISAPLEDEPPRDVLTGLRSLIQSYQQESQGFTSRRAVQTDAATEDYDQLARFGEWDGTAASVPERLS